MIAEGNISAFDANTLEYDQWFEKHTHLYKSELSALKQAIPQNKIGIEIGVGTGMFSLPFNIKFGVEPSENMALLAEQRGGKVFRAFAGKLPIENESFDFVLMVTTVCFLSDIPKAFSEVHRILRPSGEIIIELIDKYSEFGKKYEQEKHINKFYRDAHFHSTEEITSFLNDAGFHNFQYWQTLTSIKNEKEELPQTGFGKGSFIVIKATKK